MIEITRTLAVRPQPLLGEAMPGYLMRVAAGNGFTSVPQLFTSLQRRRQSALDELFARVLLGREERQRLFGVVPRHWTTDLAPLQLAVSDFNQTCRRWCPLCMKEQGVLLGHWTLKLACACTRHAVWLRDECVLCKRARSWMEVDQHRCECGANLNAGSVEPAGQLIVSMVRTLCGEVDSSCIELGDFAKLPSHSAHRLIRYLGLFTRELRPAHPGQIAGLHRMPMARKLLTGAAELLSAWPAGLNNVMATMQDSASSGPSVRRTFSPLYRVLYKDLSDPSYQFLRDAFEAYLREHWWGLVCRRNKLMRLQTISEHPRLTLPQAATLTGVPSSLIRHMVQADLIEVVATSLPSGRQSKTIHVDALSSIQAAAQGVLSMQEASRAVALPERRLRELIAANVVTTLISRKSNPSAAAWRIPRSEVERLQVQTVAISTERVISVHDALRFWRLRDGESAKLIEAVINGQLIPLSANGSIEPIGIVWVDRIDARQWLQAWRSSIEQGLSVDDVAKTIGVKQQVAYDLVNRGLLATSADATHGRRILPADLHRFCSVYVSLVELARNANTSPGALLKRIGVRPVCGPTIDGARQYFYRREDLLVSGPHSRAGAL